MRKSWSLPLLVALVSAGCISGGDSGIDQTHSDVATTTDWVWKEADAPQVPRGEASCATNGSLIVLAGGLVDPPLGLPAGFDVTKSVEIYDAQSDTWSTGPDLPVPLHHLTVAHAGERFWVAGGYPGPTFVPSDLLISWAPGEDIWTIHDRMPVARAAHGTAVVQDQLILVGGVTPSGVTARVDAYNTTTATWTRLPDAPTAREHLAVDAHGAQVFVAGGRDGAFDSQITAFDIYDFTNEKWTQGPPLPTPRGGSAGTASPHGFIVAGGEATGKTFKQIERYDTKNGSWQHLQNDPDPRHGLCIATLGKDVHVVTGGHRPGFAVSTTHNVLAPN
jgi:hypothetical protein